MLAHIVGGERMLAGDAAPQTPAGLEDGRHVRNPIARVNETWIAALRTAPPAELLASFGRSPANGWPPSRPCRSEDFDAPSWTPAGDGTYGRFMEIRLFDGGCTSRTSAKRSGAWQRGRPGGGAAIDEVAGALGYIVGKRAGAPHGIDGQDQLNGSHRARALRGRRRESQGRPGHRRPADGRPRPSARPSSSAWPAVG